MKLKTLTQLIAKIRWAKTGIDMFCLNNDLPGSSPGPCTHVSFPWLGDSLPQIDGGMEVGDSKSPLSGNTEPVLTKCNFQLPRQQLYKHVVQKTRLSWTKVFLSVPPLKMMLFPHLPMKRKTCKARNSSPGIQVHFACSAE